MFIAPFVSPSSICGNSPAHHCWCPHNGFLPSDLNWTDFAGQCLPSSLHLHRLLLSISYGIGLLITYAIVKLRKAKAKKSTPSVGLHRTLRP